MTAIRQDARPPEGMRAGWPRGESVRHARLADADLDLLLTIRHFEQTLLSLFASGHIAGTTHTCLGQEYIPVAMTPLLAPAFTFSNHRGHGHYLAQFGDLAGLLAEITGRAGAVCGGVGGSQHVFRDGFCSTGVQGEGVAAAVGVALHMRTTNLPDLAVAYIGDGTWGQGVVYEALNLAALWSLPLVIVVEHNGIAQSTPTDRAMAGTVAARAAAFGVRHAYVDSTCVVAIRDQLAAEVARVRDGGGPLVVEFRTQRLGPHSKGDDTRPAAELAALTERDWYTTYARQHPAHFAARDAKARATVAVIAQEVLAREPVRRESAA
ncbi:thiamine pyrophosphate-dependent dehydrogenase E1 component subunit alpha [Micromonospora sp. NPDC005652]|uniref:thiamine pyrophosphate-dependent dehydrogenase E1 component subunit alpha n=1 Tax=Micromonospora sp. NPDC005652 TaxID=3157046 RepID=UPI0033C240EE